MTSERWMRAGAAVAVAMTAWAPGAAAGAGTPARSTVPSAAPSDAVPEGDAAPEEVAERWVRAAVLDLLGRPATDLEVATLSGRLVAGTTRGVIAKELARSPEWTGAVVTDLYQHILDRDPDAAGLEFWIGRLRDGDRVASVAVSIYGSPEYYAEVGGTAGAYVDALYQSVLGRPAEAGGRAYWIDRLEGGTSRWVVARSVFLSAEARGRRVDALYLTLLGRPASAADRAYWAGRLAREDDIVLAAHLVGSAEHQARAQTRSETEGYELDPSEPVELTTSSFQWTSNPTVGVSGDGATIVHSADRYVAADLRSFDVASGRSDVIAALRSNSFIVPQATVSRPSLSDDGRYVAVSDASPFSFGGGRLFDRWTGTETALVGPTGDANTTDAVVSADGSTVAYGGPPAPFGTGTGIVVRAVATGVTTALPTGNGISTAPRLSGDGRLVVFRSDATDLVPGDDNGQADVFLHDRSTGTTTRLTDGDGPSGEPWISANGTTVAFTSTATDLVAGDTADDGPGRDTYAWSRATGAIRRVSSGAADTAFPSVSGDGRIVLYLDQAATSRSGRPTLWDRSSGATAALAGDVVARQAQISTDGGDVTGVADQVEGGVAGFRYLRWSLRPVDRLAVEPTPLPDATRHEAYSVDLEVAGGPGATVTDAQLPTGFSLDGTTISGTPELRPGPFGATLLLADEAGRRSLRRTTIEVRSTGTLAYLPTEDGGAYPPAATPDGETVAYAKVFGFDDFEVWRRASDGTESLVAGGILPSISDDGTEVALVTNEPLTSGDVAGTFDAYVVGPGGAAPLARGTGGGAAAVALSGDGTKAVVATEATGVVSGEAPSPGTYLVDVASGVATRLTADAVGPVAISDDGTVVVATEPNIGASGRQVVRFDGGTRTVIDQTGTFDVPTLDVSADGDHVVYAKRSLTSGVSSSLRLWSQGAGPAIVLDEGEVRHAKVSADGSVVMFVGGDGPDGSGQAGDLFRWERSTGEVDWAVARRDDGSGAVAVDLTADGATAFFLTDQDLTGEAGDEEGWLLHTWTAP